MATGWEDFDECIKSADSDEEIVACLSDFYEREPTGLTKDIIGICIYNKGDKGLTSCLAGSVQSLALIGSPTKNDYTTEYETVEKTVTELDNYKRAITTIEKE